MNTADLIQENAKLKNQITTNAIVHVREMNSEYQRGYDQCREDNKLNHADK